MQWNTDVNAGFSVADPADLYLPVHSDYETTNIEVISDTYLQFYKP